MKHHIIAMMVSCILVAAVLTGCKTSADETAAAKPDTTETTKPPEPEEAEPEEVEAPVEDTVPEEPAEEEEDGIDSACAQLYFDHIQKLFLSGTADQFALVNVNDDNIPELVACSSEGSWEKDQVFLYTIYNDEVSLLISDISPGLDGHFIAYYEGENLVVQSGSAAGERYEYYQIQDGQLEFLTSFSSFLLDDMNYRIGEQEVSETDYLQTQKDFVSAHGAISTFELAEIHTETITFDNDYLEYMDVSSKPYMTFDEISSELKKFLKGTAPLTKPNVQREPWEIAYKNYLYDVMAGKQPIPDTLEYITYAPDFQIDFSLQNITGNAIPELLISGINNETYWWIYTMGEDGTVTRIGALSYYNPESNELFVNEGSSFEGYSVYKIVDGRMELEYDISEGDVEGQVSPYYRNQENISPEEFEAFRAEFQAGLEKYGVKGRALNVKNIEKTFGE